MKKLLYIYFPQWDYHIVSILELLRYDILLYTLSVSPLTVGNRA